MTTERLFLFDSDSDVEDGEGFRYLREIASLEAVFRYGVYKPFVFVVPDSLSAYGLRGEYSYRSLIDLRGRESVYVWYRDNVKVAECERLEFLDYSVPYPDNMTVVFDNQYLSLPHRLILRRNEMPFLAVRKYEREHQLPLSDPPDLKLGRKLLKGYLP